jgi:ribonuclease G
MSEITKELIITTHQKDVQIAFLEDKRLVELHREKSSDQFSVGDIYLGKVRRLHAGLRAAFVDIGAEKDAFLHYSDLGSKVKTINEFVAQAIAKKRRSITNFPSEPTITKTGEINEVLSTGQLLLVQIAKEAISTKGPRVTTEISFAGRYVVLVPFGDKISISQKIKNNEERNRLKKIVQGIKPRNFGIIIRTVAKDKNVEEIEADLKQLVRKWNSAVANLPQAKPPSKIVDELDKTSVLIRDFVNETFHAIHIDSPTLYQEVKNYINSFSENRQKSDIVKLYKGSSPIFEYFNVAKQIKSSFGKVVTLKNGIYLIIEHTEAMHVIDVNSGNRMRKSDKEESTLEINIEAAAEIARQLRLRDMGGLIVIDFIDLEKAASRKTLHKKMTEFMANDRAKHTILPPSKFGLVEITRQRVRQATTIEIEDQCPSCQGTGKIKPLILIEEELENMLEFLFLKQIEKSVTIAVHPYIYAFLTKGLISKRVKWMLKFRRYIRIESKQGYQLLEYRFFNSNLEEIVLWNRKREK